MMPCRREDQRQPCIPVNIPSIFIKTAKPAQMGANGAAARESAEPWYFQRRPTYESKAEVPDSNMAPSTPSTRKKPFRPMASERPRRELEPGSEPEAPSIPPVPAASYTPPDSLSVPLFGVLAVLPSEIRRALNGSDARITAFVIPLDEIETRMRSGRLHFKWSQLRAWCSVGVSALAAPDMDIDLPLATVVPLFMAARETPVARKQVEVDTRIRDVFSKSKKSPGGSATFSSRDNPTSASPPRPAAGQAGLTAPAQIIEHLRALDGVTGAFISTADGLLVAGDVPDASENVLAAFAPTVFAQLTKYSDMARLGLPESIDIHLTGTTVHVRKADKLFLGILIPGSRLLPFQEITRISAALQPHSS